MTHLTASLSTTFVYDATNKLTSRTLPSGVVSTHQYDGLDRLTRLTHAKTGNTLDDFQYQFNAVNNITQMIDAAGTHNYSYDTLDRLTAATHPNQTNESYTLDDVGNRTASHQGSSYSYQAFNRLVSANGTTFGYDTNGNLTSKTDASGTWTYSWDFENRLKQASRSGGVTVTYNFDALGRRVQSTSSASGTERFVYDGADVVRDLDGTGATTADYLNGPGIDNKLRQTISATASYCLTDHLGTTRALTDTSGSIASNLSYDSFGNVISGSAATRYSYTGRESDSEIGLMYYRARWYDSSNGRFVSEDPIGFIGGINFYSYVSSNPVNLNDPFGLEPSNCQCQTDLLGHAAQVSAGFGDTISAMLAGSNPAVALIAPGWSPTAWLRGFTPGAEVVDPNSGGYLAGQIGGLAWGTAISLAGGRPINRPSGLGDLTRREVQQIQRTVNQAGRPLEVVGSAARCQRTPRSDIDYLVPHGSLPYYETFGFQRGLPGIDPKGLIPGVHNPYMGPAIRFEPGAIPIYIPRSTP